MLATVLTVVMLVGLFAVPGFAEESAITLTVGEGKQFETLEAAFAEAVAKKYTNITYEIYGMQTLSAEDDGDGKLYSVCARPLDADVEEVHFVGKDEQAGIFLNDPTPKPKNSSESATTYLTAYGTELVTFSNLTIDHNKESEAVNGKGDRVCSAWYLYSGDAVTYTDCVFKNIVFSTTKNETYQNCDFINDNSGSYALFYSGVNDGQGGSLVIDGCNFTGTRAVKTYSDDTYNGSKAVLSSFTVKNSNFTVYEKAAIEDTGAFMEGAKVTITGNTFNFCKGGKAVNDAAALGTTDEEIAKNNQFDVIRPIASIAYTATDITYENGSSEGEIIAKADVTNNLTKAFTVAMVTAEYAVGEKGTKTLLQAKTQTKEIAPGVTADFANSLIPDGENTLIQTTIVSADNMEPIVSVKVLNKEDLEEPDVPVTPDDPEEPEESVIYISTETGEDNIPVSIYKINRFDVQQGGNQQNESLTYIDTEMGENETPISIYKVNRIE